MIDNNLTRRVSANDARVIACLKGLMAGPVNIAIAVATGATVPTVPTTAAAMLTGRRPHSLVPAMPVSRIPFRNERRRNRADYRPAKARV